MLASKAGWSASGLATAQCRAELRAPRFLPFPGTEHSSSAFALPPPRSPPLQKPTHPARRPGRAPTAQAGLHRTLVRPARPTGAKTLTPQTLSFVCSTHRAAANGKYRLKKGGSCSSLSLRNSVKLQGFSEGPRPRTGSPVRCETKKINIRRLGPKRKSSGGAPITRFLSEVAEPG